MSPKLSKGLGGVDHVHVHRLVAIRRDNYLRDYSPANMCSSESSNSMKMLAGAPLAQYSPLDDVEGVGDRCGCIAYVVERRAAVEDASSTSLWLHLRLRDHILLWLHHLCLHGVDDGAEPSFVHAGLARVGRDGLEKELARRFRLRCRHLALLRQRKVGGRAPRIYAQTRSSFLAKAADGGLYWTTQQPTGKWHKSWRNRMAP
uniref:Uncharacterized protein n=1 Tax=Chrysotila carterae TaxID=13221 RepID=A0A7S4BYQ1_CHRCT